MNFTPNVHKTIGLVLTLLVLGIETLGKHVGIGDELRMGLVTFLTGAAVIVQGGKTGGGPPSGGTTRIVGGLGVVLLALCVACTPSQRAAIFPAMGPIEAVAQTVTRVLGYCEDEGIRSDELVKAVSEKDYYAAVPMALKALRVAAKEGHEVDPQIVASLTLAQQLLDVQGVEAFAKWSAKP